MRRKVDELGRIVLPIEMRNNFNIAERDELEITELLEGILLSKPVDGCHFCKAAVNLVRLGNTCVCRRCIDRLAAAEDGETLYNMPID